MATAWRLPATVDYDHRRAERRAVAVDRATVREHGQEPSDARLLDLSIYGCRLAVTTEHQAGDRLWLRFDGGLPVAAAVIWTDRERIGCRFDKPLASAAIRELTRALS